MGKLLAAFSVFQKGKSVANPAAWKKGQITVTLLVPFILALVHFADSFGYKVSMDEGTASAIALGVVALVNWLLTLATSQHVGIGRAVTVPNEMRSVGSTDASAAEAGRADDSLGGD